MGRSATSSPGADDNSVSARDRLLKKENVKEEQKECDDKLRKITIYCHYFTFFVNALATTITYSSLWAYIKTMDVETTTWYLGLVHAAFNGGELCFILLYGIWVQYRPAIEPLTFSLVALIIGSALYGWSSSFGYSGKFVVLAARLVVGCSTGNDVIITVLLSEQTSLKERTSVFIYSTLAQAIGFIVGPVVQSCFVPFGSDGFYLKALFLRINMYTMAGIFCIFLGLINLAAVWIYGRNEFSAIEEDSDNEDHNPKEDETQNSKDVGNGNKSCNQRNFPDIIAIITVLTLFFFVRHILVFIEVMLPPMAMDLYAFSDDDTISYVSLILAIVGACSIFIFIGTEKLASRVGDRVPLIISAIFGLLGFLVLWPGSSTYPKLGHFYTVAMNTTEGIKYAKKVTLGCSPFHSWCKTTPIITFSQMVISIVFLLISFPISYTILPSLYTKIIKPGRQGFMMSLLNISGNFSRISGPTMFTSIYSYYGPKILILIMDVGLFLSLLLSAIFYGRLIPYKDYIRHRNGK